MFRVVVAILCCLSIPSLSVAQRFTVNVEHSFAKRTPAFGREYLFAIPQNPGAVFKHIYLYVSSPASGIFHYKIGSHGSVGNIQIWPNRVSTVPLPTSAEMTLSGQVEDKTVHVWSDDAPLECNIMSRGDIQLTDTLPEADTLHPTGGFGVIPKEKCDTEYVVASYESYFGSLGHDYPSEFTITAFHDNTILVITPHSDLRAETADYPQFPANHTFTQRLDSGQSIQYQTVLARDADNYDVTGTVIHASQPIEVIAASQDPNIPIDFTPNNFIAAAIPPVSVWGKTYYTSNFFQTDQNKDASSILVVGSHNGQTIMRYDPASGLHTHCILDAAFDHYLRADVTEPSRFTSDYPFMLVQYINSSTYPDGLRGNGNPAMIVIPPVEQYAKHNTYQNAGKETPFINYINVIARESARNTTFDGQNIKRWTKQAIDGIYGIYRISNVPAGEQNPIVSDSGVGVYGYGYGDYASYGWPGSVVPDSLPITDSIPPGIQYSIVGNCIHAVLTDSGSGLASIDTSLSSNLSMHVGPGFTTGSQSTTLDLCLMDSTIAASATITVHDRAGNSSTLTLVDKNRTFRVDNIFFDSVKLGTTKTLPLLYIANPNPDTMSVTAIASVHGIAKLALGHFENILPRKIAPGQMDSFYISYTPTLPAIEVDTIYVTTDIAGKQRLAVFGRGLDTVLLSVLTSNKQKSVSPNELAITALSPNPTSGEFSVSYATKHALAIQVEVCNIVGNPLRTFDMGSVASGDHAAKLDLSTLSNGEYILRVSSGGYSESRKIVVAR